jgi:SNF2 family DNA or RNA helicase
LQNNVEELYSLFLFLRAKPLDDWQLFKERIAQPVKAGRPKLAMKRLHVRRLFSQYMYISEFDPAEQAILKAIMLRRTKDATIGKLSQRLSGLGAEFMISDGKPILNLPARLVNIVSCEFDKAERDFYDALEKKQALTFNRVTLM